MTDDIKYCADCKFCTPSKDHATDTAKLMFAKCLRPKASVGYGLIHPDLAIEDAKYCTVERQCSTECGLAAKFFEPKVSA